MLSPFNPAAFSSADKVDLATAKNIDAAVLPPQRSSLFTLHGTSHASAGNFSSLETSWSVRQAHSFPLWRAAYLWLLWWHRIIHERMLTSCQIWLALDKERYSWTVKQPSKSETRKSQSFCPWCWEQECFYGFRVGRRRYWEFETYTVQRSIKPAQALVT